MTGSTLEPAGVGLADLLHALDSAVVGLVVPPAEPDPRLDSVMLVDTDDLALALDRDRLADVCVLAGVPEDRLVDWLQRLSARDPQLRPRAVLSKVAPGSPALAAAARRCGVALIAVNAQARTETLLAAVRGVLDRSSGASGRGRGELDADNDLFGLARTVASLTNGMVTIEDDRSQVLAYSASNDAADEVRRLSILGREGPADYLRQLRERGVFDRLRRSDEVVEVPPDPELGLRGRLVVSIRPLSDPTGRSRPLLPTLGAIWVQEGHQPLSSDAEAALRGASAVAARLISRSRNAPSNEAIQIQRLLGALGGGVDVPSLAAALSVSTAGPAVVIGFERVDGGAPGAITEVAAALRLHASAFARESLVTAIGDRLYALLPRTPAPARVPAWTGGVIERIAAHSGVAMRAAVAAPVAQLADVSAARVEVDRVLDGTTGDQRVTTLADSRTPVLLGEMLDLIGTRDDLRDPRMNALTDYDARHATVLEASVEEYLAAFGDVRRAATALQIHPNTLRYRIGRAEQLLDLDLSDPAGRLLVELQLMVRRRTGR